MAPLAVVQLISTLLSILVVGAALSKWRHPQMMYFACLALAICISNASYLFEVTASSFDAALVACKAMYFGSPFIGPFYYLFTRDYCGSPVRKKSHVFLMMVLPAIFSLLVFTWPAQQLYYQNLSFTTQGAVPHLVITPGPLYYLSFAYNISFVLISSLITVPYYSRGGRLGRQHTFVFLTASSLPILAQFVNFAGLLPSGWDPLPLAMALNVTLLVWYLTRYRQKEWQSLGRAAVLQRMKDAYILIDNQNRFLDANTVAVTYFPQLSALIEGASMRDIEGFPSQLFSQSYDDYDFTLQQGGETLYLRASRSPLIRNQRAQGTCILIYDNTETHKLLQELEQLATHDSLTGLFNRGTFFSRTQRDYDLCVRNGEDGSILMLDLDNFKHVNDQYGHASGDAVLTAISGILLSRLRHTDIAGRYGGEELVVWLPGASCEAAASIAEDIRLAIEAAPFSAGSLSFNVTISIGVSAIIHGATPTLSALIDQADSALYRAKRKGRNRVVIHAIAPVR